MVRVVIVTKGSFLESVYSDSDGVELVHINRDTDSASPEELTEVFGEPSFIAPLIKPAVNSELVKEAFCEMGEAVKKFYGGGKKEGDD